MRKLALVSIAAVLAACAAGLGQPPAGYPATGARVVLHQGIEIAAQRATAPIQGGQPRNGADINPYHPYCLLEMRDVRDTSRTVAPDEFTVERVHRDILYAQAPARLRPVARMLADDGAPSYRVYNTDIYLRSARQPQVLRLSCRHWQDPSLNARHLTADEIRAALGALITVD